MEHGEKIIPQRLIIKEATFNISLTYDTIKRAIK